MNAPAARDPSRSSYYVSDALYRELIANFADWQDDARALSDPAVRDEFRRLIEREARLLDQLRYDDWLAMYTPECVYWVPSTPNAGDPRREIAIMFDDRRRLEDRVYRLRTGFAWSQAPASRTVRLITNVEALRHRKRRRTHAAVEFSDQRILGRRNPFAGRLGRASCGPQRRWLENPGQAGEPDRLRSVDPQSKHHFLEQHDLLGWLALVIASEAMQSRGLAKPGLLRR